MNLRFSVAALIVALSCGGQPAAAPPDLGDRVVLVELFTSQGCSSCPTADRLLSELQHDPVLGSRVVPLSFHVDYWNSLGWSDPFSSARWTSRQRAYSKSIGVDVYTPQLVVNGREAVIGSREGDVRRAIIAEAGRPSTVELNVEKVTTEQDNLTVDVRETPARGDVWVALWESGLTTPVPRGENRGRTLNNDRVVRDLRAVDLDRKSGQGSVTFDLGRSWNRQALGVAVFASDPETGEVLGAVAR